MARSTLTIITSLCLGALLGCQGQPAHQYGEAAREHGDGGESPAQAVTVWTDKTELFMEYRPLVVAAEISFATHVTLLPSFKPLTGGAVTVSVAMREGGVFTGRADRPASPGIFRPAVRVERSGECELRVHVEADGLREEIAAGACWVFADEASARTAPGQTAEPAGTITFLKEQQWRTDFATAAVEQRDLQASIQASGEIRAAAGKDARVVAPTAGRVTFGKAPPILDAAVRQGEALALFTPHLAEGNRASLEAEISAARAEAVAAEAQLARAERLFSEQATATKTVEETRARAAGARGRLQAAVGRLDQYGTGLAGSADHSGGTFELRSPIDGTLVAMEAASGEAVEAGTLLFRVIDLDTLWLQARVFEPDIPQVEGARSGWFTVEGYAAPFAFNETNARRVTVGHVVDSSSRTVPVIFEINNPGGRLRVGQFARVYIATGVPERALAVPETALVDDGGKAVAYVQREGEAFERRPLTLGIRDGGWVQVLAGLAPGEHVATKGAYEIKLAAASGVIPAHGHAH